MRLTARILMSLMITPLLAADQEAASEPVEPSLPTIRMEPVLGGQVFKAPVQVLPTPSSEPELAMVEQRGRVIAVALETGSGKRTILDMRDKVRMTQSEEGLLSIAYDPDQQEHPHVYLYYTASKPRRTVLSRMNVASDGTIDKSSEQTILEVDQPYWNHNGGTVLFGPDGMLYLSIGDGGAANDPKNHSQNLGNLLGTIIRIDVHSESSPYSIPQDNPFIATDGARPEIWAYGLRNVWRMHFDSKTGDLWAGDVGQNKWEEVDLIEKGGNYGWRLREGKHDFNKPEGSNVDVIDPIVEYPRTAGGSITGGFVYRGDDIPGLDGAYVFSDYMSGRVWGTLIQPDGEPFTREIYKGKPMAISSFGEGTDGELYICGFSTPYDSKGRIYRITSMSTD
ncbi:MAG: PQQ-dependent sugar dehydrogenase [Phycisphaerales bacterium]|nr:PQQ-dependent sugar dehydrogenase [Phycisphaerales bacterium]